MNCPNGCTDDNDRPLEMEFGFSELHAAPGKHSAPGYSCPNCGCFESMSERGRL